MSVPFAPGAYFNSQKVPIESKTYLCRDCSHEWTVPRGGADMEDCLFCGESTEQGTILSIHSRGHLPEFKYHGPYDKHYEVGDTDETAT
jgi:hypothetical protein